MLEIYQYSESMLKHLPKKHFKSYRKYASLQQKK